MYSILTVQIYLAEYILCMFGLRNAIEIGSSLTFASEFYWSVTRRERERRREARRGTNLTTFILFSPKKLEGLEVMLSILLNL